MLKINIVKYDRNYLEAIIQGETHTLFAPLVEYLLKHPNVEYAMYDVDHPLTNVVKFRIKTRGKNPIDVIKEVVNQIQEILDEWENKLLEELRK